MTETCGGGDTHQRIIAELGIRGTPTLLMKSGMLRNVKSRQDLLRRLRR